MVAVLLGKGFGVETLERYITSLKHTRSFIQKSLLIKSKCYLNIYQLVHFSLKFYNIAKGNNSTARFKKTFMYDIATTKRKVYELVSK
jgi:hypothetical protein